MRHAVTVLLEVTILAGATGLALHAVSQALIRSYESLVSSTDMPEMRQAGEPVEPVREDEPQDGLSPMHIDHLSGQDRSWQATEEG